MWEFFFSKKVNFKNKENKTWNRKIFLNSQTLFENMTIFKAEKRTFSEFVNNFLKWKLVWNIQINFQKCLFNHEHYFEFVNISIKRNIFRISVILKNAIYFIILENIWTFFWRNANIFCISTKFGTRIKIESSLYFWKCAQNFKFWRFIKTLPKKRKY